MDSWWSSIGPGDNARHRTGRNDVDLVNRKEEHVRGAVAFSWGRSKASVRTRIGLLSDEEAPRP